jgi:hypothetical protein
MAKIEGTKISKEWFICEFVFYSEIMGRVIVEAGRDERCEVEFIFDNLYAVMI